MGAWQGPDAILHLIGGIWRLERTVDNGARMEGETLFSPMADGSLAMLERGVLRLPAGQSVDARRSYVFKPRRSGFSVWFDVSPPRLFHVVRLDASESMILGEAVHHCEADRYLSRYLFFPDGSFAIEHDVLGARKEYRMTTRYRRF